MDTNDFLRSFAQENVSFVTRTITTGGSVGQNYWSVMIFVASDQYLTTTGTENIQTVTGLSEITGVLTVTVSDYASYTSGILQSWLYDLYASGFTGDTYLVVLGETDSITEELVTTAYEFLKPYAYHKTLCITQTTSETTTSETTTDEGTSEEVTTETTSLNTDLCVLLAKLCATDKQLLSSAPYYPFITTTPSDASTDTLYAALMDAGTDAFMSAYQDETRNTSLVALGIALATTNNSGTCVGNGFDMTQTSVIDSSGPEGTSLTQVVRNYLQGLNIQTWKWVGDNSGNVAALGDKTIQGDTVGASWIVAYITYMSKVRIAQLLTSGNFYKSEANYARILNELNTQLSLFGASGRLTGISITAPAYNDLPSTDAGDEITIANAWEATYVDHLRYVDITGTLYIEV